VNRIRIIRMTITLKITMAKSINMINLKTYAGGFDAKNSEV